MQLYFPSDNTIKHGSPVTYNTVFRSLDIYIQLNFLSNCINFITFSFKINYPIILSKVLFSSFKSLCMKGIEDFLQRSVLHFVSKNLFLPIFLSILCEDLLTGNIDLNFSCFKHCFANLMQSFLLLDSSVSMFSSTKAFGRQS